MKQPLDSGSLPSVLPSLFDIQVNGFAGVDFRDPEITQSALREAIDVMRNNCYMHRMLLTITTNTIERMRNQLVLIESFTKRDSVISETIAGYHIEGPYMSPEPGYVGAHSSKHMKAPDVSEYEQLQDAANGKICLMTIAPEWPGSSEFIGELRSRGVHISLGHTNATEKDIDNAVEAGATLCTHLGNGVPQVMHRHTNVLQHLLTRDELTACFIPDGIHIPPGTLKNFFRAKPKGKAVFVSDCMSAAAKPPGTYRSVGWMLEVGEDRVVRRPGSRNFAGSALTLFEGVCNSACWLSIPYTEAWELCSTVPAALFGVALPEIEAPSAMLSPLQPGSQFHEELAARANG